MKKRDRKKLVDDIRWRLEDSDFLLYGMRPLKIPSFRHPDLSIWPKGTTLLHFPVRKDVWPVEIEIFEICAPSYPDECEELLKSVLVDLTYQGGTLSWFMFEGVFHDILSLLTSEWAYERTYGVSIPNEETRLALTEESRRTNKWFNILKRASDYVYQQHPELKRLNLEDDENYNKK